MYTDTTQHMTLGEVAVHAEVDMESIEENVLVTTQYAKICTDGTTTITHSMDIVKLINSKYF